MSLLPSPQNNPAVTPADAGTQGHASPELALAEALQNRRAIIADRAWYERDAGAHLQALIGVSEKIVTLSEALPKPVHPQLKHYLERCSYDKALAFLSGDAREETHAH